MKKYPIFSIWGITLSQAFAGLDIFTPNDGHLMVTAQSALAQRSPSTAVVSPPSALPGLRSDYSALRGNHARDEQSFQPTWSKLYGFSMARRLQRTHAIDAKKL